MSKKSPITHATATWGHSLTSTWICLPSSDGKMWHTTTNRTIRGNPVKSDPFIMASPWHHHGTTMAPWRLIAHKEMIAMLETWEPMLKSMYEPEEKVSIGEKNPRCNGWCCFKFSFLATFLLRCSLLTAEKGFELRHSDTITVCMLNVVYYTFIYIHKFIFVVFETALCDSKAALLLRWTFPKHFTVWRNG